MYGRTNAGGGVSAKGFIQTTYPEGSICTCSNGTRTLQARDTSGFMLFLVPYIGTWTVTATDGTDIASETVEITTEGQLVSVELSYELWLYKDGNEYTEITGGWDFYKESTATGKKNAESITITSDGAYKAINTHTVKLIDLIEYDTLTANILNVTSDVAGQCLFGVAKSVDAIGESSFVAYTGVSKGINSVDVSALNGSYYVVISVVSGKSVTFDEVRVE